jgi:hypothetical protein
MFASVCNLADVGAATESETSKEESSEDEDKSCESDSDSSLGWIACPVADGITKTVEGLYDMINDQFNYQTLNENTSEIKEVWENARDIANIAFAIVFLIIIYSAAIRGQAN